MLVPSATILGSGLLPARALRRPRPTSAPTTTRRRPARDAWRGTSAFPTWRRRASEVADHLDVRIGLHRVEHALPLGDGHRDARLAVDDDDIAFAANLLGDPVAFVFAVVIGVLGDVERPAAAHLRIDGDEQDPLVGRLLDRAAEPCRGSGEADDDV